jgi:hypothetical protein
MIRATRTVQRKPGEVRHRQIEPVGSTEPETGCWKFRPLDSSYKRLRCLHIEFVQQPDVDNLSLNWSALPLPSSFIISTALRSHSHAMAPCSQECIRVSYLRIRRIPADSPSAGNNPQRGTAGRERANPRSRHIRRRQSYQSSWHYCLVLRHLRHTSYQ